MRDFDKVLLRLDRQPAVGEALVSVTYEGSGLPAATPLGFTTDTQMQLALLLEIQGLRRDLRERTFAGRLARAGRWIHRRIRPAIEASIAHLREQLDGWKLLLWP